MNGFNFEQHPNASETISVSFFSKTTENNDDGGV
jgi:hypothetical protein